VVAILPSKANTKATVKVNNSILPSKAAILPKKKDLAHLADMIPSALLNRVAFSTVNLANNMVPMTLAIHKASQATTVATPLDSNTAAVMHMAKTRVISNKWVAKVKVPAFPQMFRTTNSPLNPPIPTRQTTMPMLLL